MKNGFTLVELMITVALLGIISSIAVPSYQSYMANQQRRDAVIQLKKADSDLHEFYNINGTYNVNIIKAGDDAKFSKTYSTKFYTITLSDTSALSYKLTMTPVNEEKICGSLIIQNKSRSISSNYGTVKKCFDE